MKEHKYQRIRFRISGPGETIRFNATCDKGYSRLNGIFVSLPQENALCGATLGLRLNNLELLDDGHEVILLTASNHVAPNNKFFVFPEAIEANGATIEGRFTDGSKYPLLVDNGDDNSVYDPGKVDFKNKPGYHTNPNEVQFPYDVILNLWLTNQNRKDVRPL